MKKILLIMLVCVLALFSFTACGGGEIPPGIAWANKEILTYQVKDKGQDIGELEIITQRISKDDDKYIDGKLYKDANHKITMTYAFQDQTLTVTSLMKGMRPLATLKSVKTEEKEYVLSSYYSGKYYHYSLDQKGEKSSKRIKVKGEVVDNDIMYMYLRCFDISSGFVKMLNIPDPFNNDIQSLTARRIGSKKISVPFPDEEKEVDTVAIQISRNTAPVGEPLFAYYTPEKDEYNIGSLASLDNSKKFPVRIIENNLTYDLIKISVE